MNKLKPYNFSVIFLIIISFLITQIISILGAQKIRNLIGMNILTPQRNGFDFWQMIIVFFVGTIIFLSFLRLSKSRILFEILFSLAVFFGVWLILGTFFAEDYAVIFASLIILLRYFYPTPFTQNLSIILGIAGLSLSIGLVLSANEVLIVLVLLSFYDIIAVFITKHMVKMFKGLLERGVIVALIIPFEYKNILKNLKEIKPKDKFMFLGTGDLALPTVFVVSAYLENWVLALGAILGSLVGVYLTQTIFFIGRKRPIPALPPIATCTIIGYAIALLLN